MIAQLHCEREHDKTRLLHWNCPWYRTIVEATPEEEETTINGVQIVEVPLLDVCKACLQRKARVEPMTPPHGKCTKVWFNVMISVLIKLTAKLLFLYKPDENRPNTSSVTSLDNSSSNYYPCHLTEQSLPVLFRVVSAKYLVYHHTAWISFAYLAMSCESAL